MAQEKSVFARIPSWEAQLLDKKRHMQFIVIYLATIYRLETSAGQCFDRAVCDFVAYVRAVGHIRISTVQEWIFCLAGVTMMKRELSLAIEWCRSQEGEGDFATSGAELGSEIIFIVQINMFLWIISVCIRGFVIYSVMCLMFSTKAPTWLWKRSDPKYRIGRSSDLLGRDWLIIHRDTLYFQHVRWLWIWNWIKAPI